MSEQLFLSLRQAGRVDTLAWAKEHPELIQSVMPPVAVPPTAGPQSHPPPPPEPLLAAGVDPRDRLKERVAALRAQVDAGELTGQEAYDIAKKIRAFARCAIYKTPDAFMGYEYTHLGNQTQQITGRAPFTYRARIEAAAAALEDDAD